MTVPNASNGGDTGYGGKGLILGAGPCSTGDCGSAY